MPSQTQARRTRVKTQTEQTAPRRRIKKTGVKKGVKKVARKISTPTRATRPPKTARKASRTTKRVSRGGGITRAAEERSQISAKDLPSVVSTHIGSRIKTLDGTVSLDEFFTTSPKPCCATCWRKKDPSELTIHPMRYEIVCIDKDGCVHPITRVRKNKPSSRQGGGKKKVSKAGRETPARKKTKKRSK